MARMTTGATVTIDGLAALRRDLGQLSTDTDAMLKELNVAVATDIIKAAQAGAGRVGRQQVRAAAVLKPYKSARAGGVNLRATAKVPYAMGAEFGAGRPQFKPWRGNSTNAGYFLWPAIRVTNVMQHYSDGLADIVKRLAGGG